MLVNNTCTGHIAFTHYGKIEKVCRVLFKNTPVIYFCYQRLYPNHQYTLLPSRPDYGQYLLSPEIFPHTWLLGSNYNDYKSGYLFWNIAKEFISGQQEIIYKTIANEIGLSHGLDIIKKNDMYCDIYCFASNSPQIYQCDLTYLRQFIFYFRQECRHELEEAWHDKIALPNQQIIVDIPPILNLEVQESSLIAEQFETQKFYLDGQNSDSYLTHKEVLCLKLLAQGHTSKEAARLLKLSHRTIETHIANLKAKLSCSLLTKAIHIAKQNHVLP